MLKKALLFLFALSLCLCSFETNIAFIFPAMFLFFACSRLQAYDYDDSTPDYHSVNAAPTTNTTFSIGCRFKCHDRNLSAKQNLIWFGDKNSSESYVSLYVNSGTSYSSDKNWHSTVIIVRSAGGNIYQKLKIDDNTEDLTTTGVTIDPATYNRFAVAMARGASPNYPFDGEICDVRVWNVELTSSQIDSYINGDKDTEVKSSNLVGWWPMTRDALDAIGGNNLTKGGSPSLVSDPFTSSTTRDAGSWGSWGRDVVIRGIHYTYRDDGSYGEVGQDVVVGNIYTTNRNDGTYGVFGQSDDTTNTSSGQIVVTTRTEGSYGTAGEEDSITNTSSGAIVVSDRTNGSYSTKGAKSEVTYTSSGAIVVA